MRNLNPYQASISIVTLKEWDAQRYDSALSKKPSGQNEADEQRLNTRYPVDDEYKDLLISEPTTVVDRYGKIVVWYIPGALSNSRQVWIHQCRDISPVTQLWAFEGFDLEGSLRCKSVLPRLIITRKQWLAV
jgi:hypothetical protein